MGYTTVFSGSIRVEPPLSEDEMNYLKAFSRIRHAHHVDGPYTLRDPDGWMVKGGRDLIVSLNDPNPGQPGLWCQWIADPDTGEITWDGKEKFYDSKEWMVYIINHFLKPNAEVKILLDSGRIPADQVENFAGFTFDHVLNGSILAQGEDVDDRWRLIVVDNEVMTTILE